jgi:hypothetical protein
MDMHFNWANDRVTQGQFKVYWGPGYRHFADYFTKHHSPAHHKRMREIYIHASEQPMNWKGIRDSALRGCVNTSGKAGAHILHPPLGYESSPSGDRAASLEPYTHYTSVCNQSLTATYHCTTSNGK